MKLALLDIDGVLADDSHRVHYALDKQWKDYFEPFTVLGDTAFPIAKTFVRLLQEEGYDIAYLTGRRGDLRQITETWLDINAFPVGRLIMRPFPEPPQKIVLANFKRDIISDLLRTLPQYDDVVLFDDDPEVIRFVGEQLGAEHVMLCDWHVKEKALVKLASV